MALRIYTTAQIRQIDQDTIQFKGISSAELMEHAAQGLFEQIKTLIPKDQHFLILAGPGNNGGDALVLADLMLGAGYRLRCFLLSGNKSLSPDCALNAQRLLAAYPDACYLHASLEDLASSQQTDYIIDGLFGSGLNKSLDGFFARVVQWMNAQKAKRISLDLPSGLYGEDNRNNTPDNIVRADLVLGIQFPRLAFMLPENEDFIGQWRLSSLDFHPEALARQSTDYELIEAVDIATMLHKRKHFSHKGQFGRALLIAGSPGMCGAAILAGRAALRSGLGLLNIQVPSTVYACVQAAIPEAMVQAYSDSENLPNPDLRNSDRFSALAIGPGIGIGDKQRLIMKALFADLEKPLVLDADALTILSGEPDLLKLLPKNSILSPHPKEFDRLAGPSCCGYERLQKARLFAEEHHIYLILKGHYTCSIFPDGSCHFNRTGNAGMATAGSGDVLTGILLSLLAQNYTPAQACLLGAYLHGLSGDLALEDQSEESLMAGDLIQYLGKAFKHAKKQVL